MEKHRFPSAPSLVGWKFPVLGQRDQLIKIIKNFIKLIRFLTLGHSEPYQILLVRVADLVLADGAGRCLQFCSRNLCNAEMAYLPDRKPSLAGFTPISAAVA